MSAGCAGRQRPTPWYEVKGAVDERARRHVPQGELLGFADSEKTLAWLGVPYAAPPVGARRWRAPAPAPAWAQPLRATQYGATCPQFGGTLGGGQPNEVTGNEDCLTLNVSSPRLTAAEAHATKRPVMVWVHGGGNSIGTANTYGVMRNLAAKYGVVLVAPNYRLGVLGWFHHPSVTGLPGLSPEDRSGNFGTLDLVAALLWVKDNIAEFGGDPDNVTVFGESAGGFNTFSLLASPKAKGLFARAIVESGMPASRTLAEAEHFTDDPEPGLPASSNELLVAWLLKDGRAADRADAKRVLALMQPGEIEAYLRAKTPNELLAPLAGAHPSQGSHVPVMVGTNRDEWKLFMALSPKYVGRRFGLLPYVKDEVAYERDAALVSDLWRAVGSDEPARALTAAQGASVFAYRFDWHDEHHRWGLDLSKVLGAAHGLEIGLVFDDEAGAFDPFGVVDDDNRTARAELANTMSSYWVQFATTGQPGRGVDGRAVEWVPYRPNAQAEAAEQLMVFDTPSGGGVRLQPGALRPDDVARRVWADPTFANDDARCRAYGWLFYGFAKASGAWTAEREADFRAHCRNAAVEAVVKEPY